MFPPFATIDDGILRDNVSTISVIICSIDDQKFAAVSENYRRLLAADDEIIRIPDARSMCEGYNRGFSLSRGDLIIFSHDDIEIHAPDFRRKLLGHLDRCDLAGVAGTPLVCGPAWAWAGPPYVYGQLGQHVREKKMFEAAIFAAPSRHVSKMQALDGVFLACHRRVVESVPFDAATFTDFHHYDLDFTYRAHLAGFRLAVCCDLDVIHFSLGKWDEAWKVSAEKFVLKHATMPRMIPPNWNGSSAWLPTREQLLPRLRAPHWDE
ncbi:MAG: hypothetical protein QOF78_2592 [Phycisphaerales bacterium]|nr:hypothetical protein [Phycisphaerales bacterium]